MNMTVIMKMEMLKIMMTLMMIKIMMTLMMIKMMMTMLMMMAVSVLCTWHVAEAEVSDAVVVVEEDVEGVQCPGRLHQQARPQRHHQPDQANTI